jgi:hypothetical protein
MGTLPSNAWIDTMALLSLEYKNRRQNVKIQILGILLGCLVAAGSCLAGGDEIRFIGDKIVAPDEVVSGDAIAITGNLIVRGHITGSAIAYVGDVSLDSTAIVDGDVIAKQGRVFQTAGSKVAGDVVQGRLPKVKIGREEATVISTRDDFYASVEDDHYPVRSRRHDRSRGVEDFKISYNKVDGLYLGLTLDEAIFNDYGIHFRTFGSGGYAFSSHSWQGQGGFGFGVLPRGQLELSLDAFHLTYTEDAWYINDVENSLAAFFIHEDFRDYYQREGFGSTLSWKPTESMDFGIRYQAEQHQGLENATDWALFGGHKTFQPNLPIIAGMLRELIFSAGFDWPDHWRDNAAGWKINAELELTNPHLNSDFDYRRALLDVRRYQPLTKFINFDTRVRFGNSEGTLPWQKRFTLGGPSSLPGFDLKHFSGREVALVNAELRLHDSRHSQHGFFHELGLLFFTDVGMASDYSLLDMKTNNWAHDVGVGIGDNSGNLRLQIAKRTDTSEDAYVWMLRVQKPF